MCVAIVMMEEDRPDRDELQQMEAGNPDGGGVGWYEGGRCHWVKGLTADEIDLWLDDVPRPAFAHFRFATVGKEIPELCHPFPVTKRVRLDLSGDAASILIHNGHWSEWSEAAARRTLPRGPWSDTRLVAYLARRDRKWLSIADGKFAVMEPDGNVMLYGYWYKRESGLYYSNLYWESTFSWPTGKYSADSKTAFDSHEEYQEWLNDIYAEYLEESDAKKRQLLGEELACGYREVPPNDNTYQEEDGAYAIVEPAEPEEEVYGGGPFDVSNDSAIIQRFLETEERKRRSL